MACTGPQCVIAPLFGALRAVLPEFTGPWLDAFGRRPGWFVIAAGALAALLYLGGSLDQRIRDRMKPLWAPVSPAYASAPAIAPGRLDGAIAWLRTNPAYIAFFRLLKYQLGPLFFGLAFGLLGLMALLAPIYAVVGRVAFWLENRQGEICRPARTVAPVGSKPVSVEGAFATSTPCFATEVSVEAQARYRITLEIHQPWRDRTIPASPVGFGAETATWAMKLFVPLNRSVTSRWLQPIARIRSARGREVPLDFTQEPSGIPLFAAAFTAPVDGELYLFVNDAVLPFIPGVSRWFFYENNRGSARVTVQRQGGPSDGA